MTMLSLEKTDDLQIGEEWIHDLHSIKSLHDREWERLTQIENPAELVGALVAYLCNSSMSKARAALEDVIDEKNTKGMTVTLIFVGGNPQFQDNDDKESRRTL